MKQTAIEWLIDQLLPKDQHEGIMDIIQEAKEMEKEQIIDAFQDSRILSITNNCSSGEQYYNEIFNK